MSTAIYLRPLKIEDALISFAWRNDPQVWTYTKLVIDKTITAEIETEWIKKVLKRTQERRFAICIKDTHEYIGNVQLRDIHEDTAEFELFIGEKKYWGKGIGFEATQQILHIAFTELKLNTVFLYVHPNNTAAIRCYDKAGFKFSSQDELIKMVATSSTFAKVIA